MGAQIRWLGTQISHGSSLFSSQVRTDQDRSGNSIKRKLGQKGWVSVLIASLFDFWRVKLWVTYYKGGRHCLLPTFPICDWTSSWRQVIRKWMDGSGKVRTSWDNLGLSRLKTFQEESLTRHLPTRAQEIYLATRFQLFLSYFIFLRQNNCMQTHSICVDQSGVFVNLKYEPKLCKHPPDWNTRHSPVL